MKLHPDNLGDTKRFTSIGKGYVAINGERFERSLALLPDEVRLDWNAANFNELNESHFEYFITLKPEVLLLGTGEQQYFPHPGLYRALIAAGVGVEFMDTHAACRTFNILVAEDRKVIAAIIL